jgi:hypothetical protein
MSLPISSILRMKPHAIAVVLASSAAVAGCASSPNNDDSGKPEIVEVFLCSDNCPGPREKYVKLVYDGVTDEKECLKLGGRVYSYFGWGQRTYCEVK